VSGAVVRDYYRDEIGRARIVREGADLTIVATSAMVHEAMIAADALAREGVDVEIVDPRSIRPLDEAAILRSIRKTGRLMVADTSWELCGFASEIAALAAERAFADLRAPVRRVALPNCPAPVSAKLEEAFYPKASTLAELALTMVGRKMPSPFSVIDAVDSFKGPY